MEKEVPKQRKRLSVNVKEFTPKPKKPEGEEPRAEPVSVNTLVDLVMNLNLTREFEFEFPRLASYASLEQIREKFPALQGVNASQFDSKAYENAYFFVLRSSTYDDIHKAMKYGIWTSTPENNQLLAETFVRATAEKRKVVLFFRYVYDNVLNGAAEMTSDYIPEQQFDLWWSKVKWRGIFNLRWIFVKNIDLNYLSQLEGDKKIYELIDGSPLSADNGLLLLGLFQHYEYKLQNSLFNFFALFDQREDALLNKRTSIDFQFKLQKRENRKPSGVDLAVPHPKHFGVSGQKRHSYQHTNAPHSFDDHRPQPNLAKPEASKAEVKESDEAVKAKETKERKKSGVDGELGGQEADRFSPLAPGSKKSKKNRRPKGDGHGKSGSKGFQEVIYVKKPDADDKGK